MRGVDAVEGTISDTPAGLAAHTVGSAEFGAKAGVLPTTIPALLANIALHSVPASKTSLCMGGGAYLLYHVLPQRHVLAGGTATYTDILQDQQTPAFSHIIITPAALFSDGKFYKAAFSFGVALRHTFLYGHRHAGTRLDLAASAFVLFMHNRVRVRINTRVPYCRFVRIITHDACSGARSHQAGARIRSCTLPNTNGRGCSTIQVLGITPP